MQEENPSRKGIFTTGILSTSENHKIALFVTGRQHAGENLQDLLKQRTNRSPPIQMCDALSRNVPKEFETLLANCLAHGRRQFVDVLNNFPESCRPSGTRGRNGAKSGKLVAMELYGRLAS